MYKLGEIMKLRIIDKLKKRRHKDIALVQDTLMDIIYDVFPKAILHGGTAIWRCYGGNRFSEDIDIYLDKSDLKKVKLFKQKAKQRKLDIKKFKTTADTVFSKFSFKGIEVRFEASFLKVRSKDIVIKPYETSDGNYINVFTLSPESLIKEKVNTYLSRLLVRDLYDIYILLKHVENKKKVRPYLKGLLSKYKKPKDENILKALVFVGAVPTPQQILKEVNRWVR